MNLKDGPSVSRRSGCLIVGDLPDKAGRAGEEEEVAQGGRWLGDIQIKINLWESCLGLRFYNEMRPSLWPLQRQEPEANLPVQEHKVARRLRG